MDEFLVPGASAQRLIADYKLHGTIVVAYDFDNTVFDYHGKGNDYSQAISILKQAKEIGCYMICFTAADNNDFVLEYLSKNNIPCDALNENPPFFKSEQRKIYFNILLDDRAGLITAYNDLLTLIKTIKNEN